MEDSQIAAALSACLAERIGAQRYELWFGAHTRLSVGGNSLKVCAASAFVRDWLRQNFADDIRACWDAVADPSMPIEFVVEPTLPSDSVPQAAGRKVSNGGASQQERYVNGGADTVISASNGCAAAVAGPNDGQSPHADANDAGAAGDRSRRLFTLTSFVVGPSNEYAFRAAELTARGRQQASPLVFYGTTGVGKTHLLRAIGRAYRQYHPRAAAIYLSAEQFTTSFVEAIRGSGLPSFRQKCRGANLLVVDDIQFFAGKQRTLEELLHTVDTMLADGRQLALGSDRPLAELRSLGPELASRLAGGLICEIEPPEFSTRRDILKNLCREMGLSIDDDVLRAIATQITAGARELRGAMHRLQAMSHALDRPVSRELADRALTDLARHSTRAVRLADVEHVVCDVFGVEPSQLRSERKGRSLSEPRMLAMWLARKYTRAAWSEIGYFFGRRSHSTVIAAHRRVERLISSQGKVGLNDRTCHVEDAIRRLEQALRTA